MSIKLMDKGKNKDLFVDYGEFVLHYDFNPNTLFRAHRIALHYINGNSRDIDLDALAHAHQKAIQAYLSARKDFTEWPLERILNVMFNELDLDGDIPRNDIALTYKLNDHDVRQISGVRETLQELAKSRNLHIISNLPHDSLVYELTNQHLKDLFRTITISFEVGHRKPHPAIYQEAMKRAKVTPEESIFASHEEYEVEGARNVGMEGILAQDINGVLEKLE